MDVREAWDDVSFVYNRENHDLIVFGLSCISKNAHLRETHSDNLKVRRLGPCRMTSFVLHSIGSLRYLTQMSDNSESRLPSPKEAS